MADKIFLPRQNVRRGVASYNDPDGRITIVEPTGETTTPFEDRKVAKARAAGRAGAAASRARASTRVVTNRTDDSGDSGDNT